MSAEEVEKKETKTVEPVAETGIRDAAGGGEDPAQEPSSAAGSDASAEVETAGSPAEAAGPEEEAASAEVEAAGPEEEAAEPEEEAAEPEESPADKALAEALEQIAVWKDRAARIQADFDNYRKRQARERAETIQQANADLLEELLPVLDQTDTAIAAAGKDATDAVKPFADGFELVRRTLLNAVAKFGLKPVESGVGKPLDPASAEALSVMKTGQAEPGCVVFETRKGYTLGGRLLRAAQVVVEQED